jgi:L-iditol 2-dehydrogenase
MKAAILYKPKEIKIEEREIPIPGSEEVLIQVMVTGICRSDVHFYQQGKIGDSVVRNSVILGHECSGVVVDKGQKVKKFKKGDRVVIEPGFPCKNCEFCKSGQYNLCRNMKFLGTPPVDGTFREYIAAPEDCVFKIPENVSFEEAALAEPSAVAIQAVKRGKIGLGEAVAIIGAGPIGLLTLQVARSAGASKVYITDLEEFRLEKAKVLGADKVINAKGEGDVREIMKLTHNQGVDIALEAVGSSITINKAIQVVRPGGRVVVIGTGVESQLKINIYEISSKELDFLGVWRYVRAFPTALALITKGAIKTEDIITHRFPLEEIEKAMSLIDQKRKAIKVIIILKNFEF